MCTIVRISGFHTGLFCWGGGRLYEEYCCRMPYTCYITVNPNFWNYGLCVVCVLGGGGGGGGGYPRPFLPPHIKPGVEVRFAKKDSSNK